MKKGQRIIFDSGFGYELGYFVGDQKIDDDYTINLITGKTTREISISKDMVKDYSKELILMLSQKYGYTLTF
jgi:hypothetical protein